MLLGRQCFLGGGGEKKEWFLVSSASWGGGVLLNKQCFLGAEKECLVQVEHGGTPHAARRPQNRQGKLRCPPERPRSAPRAPNVPIRAPFAVQDASGIPCLASDAWSYRAMRNYSLQGFTIFCVACHSSVI